MESDRPTTTSTRQEKRPRGRNVGLDVAYTAGVLNTKSVGQVRDDGWPRESAIGGPDRHHLSQASRARDPSAADGPTRFSLTDRYQLIRRLGRGGMGEVWLALDHRLERRVAIKRVLPPSHRDLSPRNSRSPWQLAHEILQEAKAMARPQLAHPNVVAILDYLSDAEGNPCIVMEAVDGVDLHRHILKHGRPDWRGVLELMVPAGRGLAAANAAGLVHCDFKAANVFIERDAGEHSVKVGDFGLAVRGSNPPARSGRERTFDGLEDGDRTAEEDEVGEPSGRPGTWAYMSPEQIAGDPIDGRSDQYSYCVTLYELLYGHAPFGPNSKERERWTVPTAPKGSKVPRWLRTIVRRGLEPDPDRRFSDMDALLAAIEAAREREAKRKRGLAWSLGFVTLAWGLSLAISSSQVRPCPSAERHWSGIWDEPHAAKIHDAVVRTSVAWAEDTWTRIEAHFDDHRREWVETHGELCQASRDDPDANATALDLGMRCLQLDLERHRELARAFEAADAHTVTRAVSALNAMPSAHECMDTAALRQDLPWPDDLRLREIAQALRERYASAYAMYLAGHYSRALPIVTAIEDEARRHEVTVVLAEAESLSGSIRMRLGDFEGSQARLRQAIVHGTASDHRRLCAATTIELTGFLAYHANDPVQARFELQRARARSLAAGADAELLANLTSVHAIFAMLQGDYASAKSKFRESAQYWVSSGGPTAPGLLQVFNNLGMLYGIEDDAHAAIAMFERSADLTARNFGPRHPRMATPIRNLSVAFARTGQLRRSLQAARSSLDVCEGASKSEPKGCTGPLQTVVNALADMGDFAGSIAAAHELAERQGVSGARGDRNVQWAEFMLAGGELSRGRPRQALDYVLSGFDKLEARDESLVAELRVHAWLMIANTRALLHEPEAALEALHEARRWLDNCANDRSLWTANWRTAHAQLRLVQGRPFEAIDDLEAAIAGDERSLISLTHAERLRMLSQAFASAGDPTRAEDFARRSLEVATQALGNQASVLATYHRQVARAAMLHQSPFAATEAATHLRRAIELHDPRQFGPGFLPESYFELARALRAIARRSTQSPSLELHDRAELAARRALELATDEADRSRIDGIVAWLESQDSRPDAD